MATAGRYSSVSASSVGWQQENENGARTINLSGWRFLKTTAKNARPQNNTKVHIAFN
jgi:hypothetical protein